MSKSWVRHDEKTERKKKVIFKRKQQKPKLSKRDIENMIYEGNQKEIYE